MKKYVICGLSGRAVNMFIEPLVREYSRGHRIAALLDDDPLREAVCKERFPELRSVPFFRAEAFSDMIEKVDPDTVIVASRDDTHVRYILGALQSNKDVITEKPMVTTVKDAAAVIAAEAESEGTVTVTFNYRYNPYHRKIKEMILEGKLGRITSVDLNWYIDTYHGASYFKRWNRMRKYSGGLSVHKSTHHFDLVNWWLDQKPEEVFAYGGLYYYGPDGEMNPEKGENRYCGTCRVKQACRYFMRWEAGDAEDDHIRSDEHQHLLYTNYRPDACIFDEEIDIEDTYAAVLKYDGGALLNYSVHFSAPYEGYRLAINGTKGRLETTEYHAPGRIPFEVPEQTIEYFPLFESKETIRVVRQPGGHGGGDPLLLRELFSGKDPFREYDILAGSEAGAYSIAAGEGMWRSIKENRPIGIEELLHSRQHT
ncbi:MULTISPECIES: Gfo/Idh/MocA family protein [Bacillus]|uniref:Gfo/Idh/MocA family protein n=1 Tax=Bacillus TaxID=1386 RepID=UPI001583DC94|nr:Gfo/Idh/MocA family oxidoreductase [Bacillus glycinifermentans]MBU8788702.1 Gfo/Idh/MocA family oxidoreductase [Bacillus glycinifermentans]NUJ17797.1 Gfo/Idh/MocA family oxidoreductase [Bacillus glycinifermentans]